MELRLTTTSVIRSVLLFSHLKFFLFTGAFSSASPKQRRQFLFSLLEGSLHRAWHTGSHQSVSATLFHLFYEGVWKLFAISFYIFLWYCNQFFFKILSSTQRAAAAAAPAKSLQPRPTLCEPGHGSPPGSLLPGVLQARTLEWVAISGKKR